MVSRPRLYHRCPVCGQMGKVVAQRPERGNYSNQTRDGSGWAEGEEATYVL